jgi:protein tyrosine/serine phosphatase
MEIINAPESGRVFVHCKDGVDRTGTIIALHRITSEGWSTELATAEAVRYGMRRYQYWMRDYISDYRVRQRDPDEGDVKDKIGAGVRVGERAVLKVRKTAVQAVRRALP